MVERTADPKGDVWYHARSSLIQAVSSVTLEQFMASFNAIVAKAAATDAAFYEQRGVRLHSLEVTRYECADGKTATVLQEIIQETTNRINRMMKQKSDNEVEHEELTAKIAWSASARPSSRQRRPMRSCRRRSRARPRARDSLTTRSPSQPAEQL